MKYYCESCDCEIPNGEETFSDDGELLCTDCLFEQRCRQEFGGGEIDHG